MHPTTSTAPRTRRLVFLTLLAALLLLALAQAMPALAAGTFTGAPNPADYPMYVANDHSVYALRFTASGLTPLTGYNMKVRISPTATISGGSSRGFTWNPDTQQWVQERDEWSKLTTMTTDAAGGYTSGNAWTYFKFGDTSKPAEGASGTWYLVVSLKPVGGGDGTTINAADPPPVTIVDMTGRLTWATSAFRVHNGTPAAVSKSQRVEALAAGGANVYSLMRTEPNNVVEGYGTTSLGDFDIAVPARIAFDTGVHNSGTPGWSMAGFTGATADVDIALGAADTTPPEAPGGFATSRAGTTARLTWDAVTDAASYTVYQWQDPTPIDGVVNYTAQHLAVGTTARTTYDVTGLTEGETYHFEVRAVDTATNIGPPSRYPVDLSVAAAASVVGWGKQATLTGELTDGAEPFAEGKVVTVQSSMDGGDTWNDVAEFDLIALAGFGVKPAQKTQYRLAFAGDSVHAAAESDPVTVTPRVALGKPSAPSNVRKGAAFGAYGSLTPKHAAGAKSVRIKCYLKQGGKWRHVKTVKAANRTVKSATRYSARLSLPSRGSWKLVANYAATAKFAATTSGAEYMRVK
jgi:hypothetical protein